jgi:hypothetical protein
MKLRALKYLWAAPCTAVGTLIGGAVCCFGASPRFVGGVMEIGFVNRSHPGARVLSQLPFRGITFGHVVLAPTHECQAALRQHERVHVSQYEKWGLLFFVLYPANSLLQWVRGRRPYFDNTFEAQARAHEGPSDFAATSSEA